jgi:uncharacterized membrane protein (UPF0127 family)
VRFAVALLGVAVACSSHSKHDDGATPPPPPSPDEPPPPAKDPATAPKVVITTSAGDATVFVEVVSTGPKIQRGLMYRQHMPLDDGMLFLMPTERVQEFWMQNTLIALDMIFITSDLHVAGVVENAEPRTETIRKVDAPSQFVLEVNGGWARQHHVAAGAKVRFENVK